MGFHPGFQLFQAGFNGLEQALLNSPEVGGVFKRVGRPIWLIWVARIHFLDEDTQSGEFCLSCGRITQCCFLLSLLAGLWRIN